MSSWRSNSLTVLAVATGVLSPCVMVPSALAGDKIEFSAPAGTLAVPHLEREDKAAAKIDEFQPLERPDEQAQEDNQMNSSEVLIVATPEKKGARTSFTDSWYNDPTADSSSDNLDSKRRPINGVTPRWDVQRALDRDAESIYSEKKNDDVAANRENSLRTRLEALNAKEKNDYQRNDRYSKHSPDLDEGSAWSHSLFDHGFPGLERMRDGQFVPVYDEVSGGDQQAGHGHTTARPATVADDLLRNAMLPPGVAAYNAQLDAMHGKIPDATAVSPRMFHPVQTQEAVSQNVNVYAREEPPPSPPGQVQSRPAILPFPKKPGDVLR